MEPEDLLRMNRVLRHRLRNSAAGLKSSVSYLFKELGPKLTPHEQEYFPLILQECEALADLTQRMHLFFEPAVAGPPATVAEAVAAAASPLRARFPHNDLRLQIEAAAETRPLAARAALEVPLAEALANACEAAPGGIVTLAVILRGDQLEAEVSDPGLAPPPAAGLFQPFFTTKPRHLGLGLAIARHYLAPAGGTIQFEYEPGSGGRVRIRLPVGGPAAPVPPPAAGGSV